MTSSPEGKKRKQEKSVTAVEVSAEEASAAQMAAVPSMDTSQWPLLLKVKIPIVFSISF